jgi:branched-subunit amino acid aminotransferase/4-amino-4-deoxychorismate lyase
MSFLYLNGEFLPIKEAKVSVLDRSYLFGEGAFESFRSYEGKVLFLKDHLARLTWTCEFLGLRFPNDLDFNSACAELLQKNGLKNARFKILVSRMETATDETKTINAMISCEGLTETSPTYRLMTIKNLVNDSLPVSAMKTTSRITKVLARATAEDAGCHDGILLNSKGMVTETTCANIFWVDKDAVLHTVMSEQGLLGGVMKKLICDLLTENKLKYKETVIAAADISQVRELFVTNALIGIKPVVNIDGRQISGGAVGPITEMLMDLWEKKIKTLMG